jgi:hypothetical protein
LAILTDTLRPGSISPVLKAPLLAVAVWGTVSRLTNTTLSPVPMLTDAGENAIFRMVTVTFAAKLGVIERTKSKASETGKRMLTSSA